MTNSDLYVQHDEIYILIGRHSRKDIRFHDNGTYGHGSIHGRTFRDIVTKMIEVFAPKPKADEEEATVPDPVPSGPKPF